jgi:hypothetical protein
MKRRTVIANRNSYGLKKQMSTQYFGRKTICAIWNAYKAWAHLWQWLLAPHNKIWQFARNLGNKNTKKDYAPIKESDIWWWTFNRELYKLCNETETVKVFSAGTSL